MKIKLGTRASNLALIQANSIKRALEEAHPQLEVDLVKISTHGDRVQNKSIADLGQKGVFVKEIEQALLDGTIDLAVHSLKDMPSLIHPDLTLVAPPKGEAPEDAFVGKGPLSSWKDLEGMKIGSGSNRRQAQLKHWLGQVQIEPIRGNIETRMKKIDQLGLDGTLLAYSGLIRGGYKERVSLVLDPKKFIPSPNQGILALEIRRDREDLAELLAPLAHGRTAFRMEVERAFQEALSATCESPIGIYLDFERAQEDQLDIYTCYGKEVGSALYFQEASCRLDEAKKTVIALAKTLKECAHD
ncbi:MAG: hydroxymethylbilane synthase [Tissierellia bacterium]|nr:hydroxymethylbilane synthase [Tissierellia bacterium]